MSRSMGCEDGSMQAPILEGCSEGLLDRGTGSNRSNHEGDYELDKSPQESPKKFLVPID